MAIRGAQRACASGDINAALETLTGLVADFQPSDAARAQAAVSVSMPLTQTSAA
jgi:hypothetical protein